MDIEERIKMNLKQNIELKIREIFYDKKESNYKAKIFITNNSSKIDEVIKNIIDSKDLFKFVSSSSDYLNDVINEHFTKVFGNEVDYDIKLNEVDYLYEKIELLEIEIRLLRDELDKIKLSKKL